MGAGGGDLLYLLKRCLYLSGDSLPSWLEQGGDEGGQPPSFGPSSRGPPGVPAPRSSTTSWVHLASRCLVLGLGLRLGPWEAGLDSKSLRGENATESEEGQN